MNVVESSILRELQIIDNLSSYMYINPELAYILSDSPTATKRRFFPKSNTDFINELITLNKVLDNYDFSNINTTVIIPRLYMREKPEYSAYNFSSRVFDLSVIENEKWYLNMPYRFKYYITGFNTVNSPSGLINTIRVVKKLYGLKSLDINYAGLLTIDIGMDDFNTILKNLKPTEKSKSFIIDNSGIVNVATDNENYLGSDIKNILPSLDIASLDRNYGFVKCRKDKDDYYVAYKKIDQIGWTIINISPAKELFSILYSYSNSMYILLSLLIVVGVLLSMFLSENISHPIHRLISSMKTVKQGDFDIQIDYNRNDEFTYLIGTYRTMIGEIKELISKLYISESEKKEAELKALMAQINPHFLYNTLDSINWLAIRHKVPDISRMVTALSDFFRYSLSKGNNIILLKDEIKQVESYLAIQKIRFSDRLDYSFSVSPEVNDLITVKLILQPIVENAIIHGIEKKQELGFINISAELVNNLVEIKISDNGVGTDLAELQSLLLESPRRTKAYGIKNVDDRIKNTFGPEFGISFHSNESGGLTVSIVIPAMNQLEDKSCTG